MRIVFPAFSLRKFDWDRFEATLKPLSRKNKIQIYSYDQLPNEQPDWCTLKHVPFPPDITNLDNICRYAVKIISALDDFDLVYCWSSGAYFQLVNVTVAMLANKPVVMHVNGDGALSRSHHLLAYEKMREDAVDKLSLNNVDVLVPISSILYKAIVSRIKNKHRLTNPIPFSVDPYAFYPLPSPKELTVGYSGRISPEKGTPFLFKVAQQTPCMKYRFAGPIQMSIKFPDNCHYDGCLFYGDMVHFYGLCSVVALPSYGEGMPASILEAYACGRPVICTPESRPKELKLFGYELPHDVDQWKQLINELDPYELKTLGADARKWVSETFPSWKHFSKEMQVIFEALK